MNMNQDPFRMFEGLMGRSVFAFNHGQEAAPQAQGVSDQFIENLPKAGDDKQGDCYICLEKVGCNEKETCELPCGHAFDKACLTKWLKEHDSCPVCRAKLDQDRPR